MPWMHCPAKLNLSLHLLGKRTDGYTALDSWVAKLGLFDVLALGTPDDAWMRHTGATPLEGGIFFSSNDAYLQMLGESNLVIQAVRAVQQAFTQQQNTPLRWPEVHVHLDKHLPYQAGLGSASSNAATATLMANTFYAKALEAPELSVSTLHALGEKIGSDVPLFLVPDASLVHMQGRGEIIATSIPQLPDALKHLHVMIVKLPQVNIPTKEAFAAIHQGQHYGNPTAELTTSLSSKITRLEDILPCFRNDFEAVALTLRPELQALYQAFTLTGVMHTLLCGSGSAVAGFYPQDVDILAVQTSLRAMLPQGAYCKATRFL